MSTTPPPERLAKQIGPYVQVARKRFPTYPLGSANCTWDEMLIDPIEAEMLAYAAIEALDALGFKVVPKNA